MLSWLLAALLVLPGKPTAPLIQAGQTVSQPKPKTKDTSALISHRWLVSATEKAGKKTDGTAGSMQLYMNFFSNGGFDFAGIGDDEPLIWRLAKGSVEIYRKSSQGGKPEASYRVEKINSKTMVLSGLQAGMAVRYYLSHQAGY